MPWRALNFQVICSWVGYTAMMLEGFQGVDVLIKQTSAEGMDGVDIDRAVARKNYHGRTTYCIRSHSYFGQMMPD
jgi:hypothetical protein